MTTKEAVEAVLETFQDPESGRPITKAGQVHQLDVTDDAINVALGLTTHSAVLWDEATGALKSLLQEKFSGAAVEVTREVHNRPPQPLGQLGLTAKSVIAVGSGKGGVGKSTVAASLAWALKLAGSKVGLMDADVYGPSIPHLMGLSGRPEIVDNRIQPRMKDDLPVMSIGFLVEPDQAVVWRGPMLHQTVTQFLRDVAWGDLDYLIIDMPPGTGDIALTLSQLLPLTGAVVVCTPQEVALLDAVKAITMFGTVKIPVLGMVENMTGDIFGRGGAKAKAEQLGMPFLGEIPLNSDIRAAGDASDIAGSFDNEELAGYYNTICHNLVRNLAQANQEAPPLPSLSVLS